ncbi:sensor domain-containing protein [Nocardia sp. JCM 34519.1]|uniref:sensor domain-containing protein n=1 Tax=Nocardia sp. JCM 34519.1 TaxID=2876119 RepID=UPI001CE3E07B|nr:sensor domain-containing protein [Nocardia sp. JCM 34519.1]
MAPSSSIKHDAALNDRLASFLLHEDEINALRTSQDGPEQWYSAGSSEPADTEFSFPDLKNIEPSQCGDAVRQSYNFEITDWTGFSQYSRIGPGGSNYGIVQNVAAYPDASAAQRAYKGIADKIRACGNTSGTLAVKVSDIVTGPFSVELRDVNPTSLRWTFVSHRDYRASSPQYSTEVILAVVNNMVVCVSASRFSDAEHLATALMQAITQRITSSR